MGSTVETVADLFRSLIAQRGLTQVEVSRRARIDPKTISSYLTGGSRWRHDTLFLILEELYRVRPLTTDQVAMIAGAFDLPIEAVTGYAEQHDDDPHRGLHAMLDRLIQRLGVERVQGALDMLGVQTLPEEDPQSMRVVTPPRPAPQYGPGATEQEFVDYERRENKGPEQQRRTS